jgi:flagellar hook-associated protein 3 FlgL
MISIATAPNSAFLANLSSVEARILKDDQEVSSGLAVQQVSDSPDQVTEILQLQSAIAGNTQIGQNLGQVNSEVSAAGQAVSNGINLMDQAIQIGTEGASSITGASTDTQLASQVQDIITQMLGLAQTQVEGRYVFSGDSDQTSPYAGVNLAVPNGVGAYQGSASTRTIQNPNGSTFSVAYTAQQIFDSGGPSSSVFQSLTALYSALQSGSSTAVSSALSNVQTANLSLNGMNGQYGDIQNQVTAAESFQSQYSTTLQSQLSTAQDADEAAAITDMQQASTAEQAALQAEASLPRQSLFSFLA